MKKHRLNLFLGFAFLFCIVQVSKSIEPVDPNTRTSWPSAYPMAEKILAENFQDWPNTRANSDPMRCNENHRIDNFQWKYMRIHRPSGESGALVNVYLVSAEIQPFCDTQSGLTFLTDTVININKGNCGPSNPGVTSGNITLYDSTYLFPKDPTGANFRRGALIVGQLPSITLIQYTTSSFGAKRGFTLDYSTDRGKTWTILRREHGKTIDSTKTTSGYQLTYSTRGIVWEENVDLTDAMIRFRINDDQPQLARIHDLRIFGTSPLREDCDDTQFENAYGVDWGAWLGIDRNPEVETKMSFDGRTLKISGYPQWTQIINLAGQVLYNFGNDQIINLDNLTKGVYTVRSKDASGMMKRFKICI